MNCPKCLRPFNEGNSPNAEECNQEDDEEGLCAAYAKIARLKTTLEDISTTAHCIALAGPRHTPTLEDAWAKFLLIDVKASRALAEVRKM